MEKQYAVSPKYRKHHLMARTCTQCGETKLREKFVYRPDDRRPLVCRACERLMEEMDEVQLENKRRADSLAFYHVTDSSFTLLIRMGDTSPVPPQFKPLLESDEQHQSKGRFRLSDSQASFHTLPHPTDVFSLHFWSFYLYKKSYVKKLERNLAFAVIRAFV